MKEERAVNEAKGKKLFPERRQEIARQAIAARWNKEEAEGVAELER